MKITDVEAIVLDSGKDYRSICSGGSHGCACLAAQISRMRHTAGRMSKPATRGQSHRRAPSGGQIGSSRAQCTDGRRSLEHERLWQKMFVTWVYGRRRWMHMLSGADIALGILRQSIWTAGLQILGAKYATK